MPTPLLAPARAPRPASTSVAVPTEPVEEAELFDDEGAQEPTIEFTPRLPQPVSHSAPEIEALAIESPTVNEPAPAGRVAAAKQLPAALRVTEPGAARPGVGPSRGAVPPRPTMPILEPVEDAEVDADPAALERTRPRMAARASVLPAAASGLPPAARGRDRAPSSGALPQAAPTPSPARAPAATAGAPVRATPAPLWRRPLAWLVDLLLLGTASVGPVAGVLALRGYELRRLEVELLTALAPGALGFCALMAVLYAVAFAVLGRGQTPGRRLLGLCLVDRTARPPGVVRAFVRALLALASFGLFLGGFWYALFDRRGQTWHDKLTGTFVVRLRPSTP